MNGRDPDAATQAARLEPAQAQGDEDETLAASAAAPEPEPRSAPIDEQTTDHTGALSRHGQRPLSERDPDADLVARVGARDTGAVRTLVASKLPRLLALATRMLGDRMEAEDVAQETFVRIWKEAPHWRTGEAKFDTWLHRVVLNLCYDRLRGRRDELSDTLPDTPDPDAPPDQRIETRSRDERVRAALTALPSRQREALVLTYYQELSNQQASDLMGISVDALESLLARARRTLRAQLAGERAGKDSA